MLACSCLGRKASRTPNIRPPAVPGLEYTSAGMLGQNLAADAAPNIEHHDGARCCPIEAARKRRRHLPRHDVKWRVQRGVDPATPRSGAPRRPTPRLPESPPNCQPPPITHAPNPTRVSSRPVLPGWEVVSATVLMELFQRGPGGGRPRAPAGGGQRECSRPALAPPRQRGRVSAAASDSGARGRRVSPVWIRVRHR